MSKYNLIGKVGDAVFLDLTAEPSELKDDIEYYNDIYKGAVKPIVWIVDGDVVGTSTFALLELLEA